MAEKKTLLFYMQHLITNPNLMPAAFKDKSFKHIITSW